MDGVYYAQITLHELMSHEWVARFDASGDRARSLDANDPEERSRTDAIEGGRRA